MIFEELVGSLISLCSSLIIKTPTISQERQQPKLIFEESHEEDEVCEAFKQISYK